MSVVFLQKVLKKPNNNQKQYVNPMFLNKISQQFVAFKEEIF